MIGRACRIAPLLFFSGLCALFYQVVWLREFRLVFGASTPASAAVLAVFMGGIGWGSLRLSGRADRAARPLRLYAHLEGGIALASALTPLLLVAARAAYGAVGGTTVLGLGLGTVVRLLLSAAVLLPATFLMGGTLPAAARAAIGAGDGARRTTALLYGVNTLGAVLGAAISTFVMLEVFGAQLTLWLASGVNALVAVGARVVDRRLPLLPEGEPRRGSQSSGGRAPAGRDAADEPTESGDGMGATRVGAQRKPSAAGGVLAEASDAGIGRARRRFVLAAAAAVGFVFLQMEIVWYRVLSPLLGGSTYTFGLILAMALLGIGLGGVAYTLRSTSRLPTLGSFAWSCALEAIACAIPYALGDRVAVGALFLRSFGSVGLPGHVLGWTVVAALVILPAALVAGYQFPLLIAVLGRGRRNVGRHVGLAYAANTAGAIGGSLLGGFVLLPQLGALGAWRLCTLLLVALAMGAAIVQRRDVGRVVHRGRMWTLAGPVATAGLGVVLVVVPTGPTAFWRHRPIGAGRSDALLGATRNRLRDVVHEQRRGVTWEKEGLESTIGLHTLGDISVIVNGKSDGSAVHDSGTQVMGGLLGALLHPGEVRRALVIGLGTGSTAGWLGRLPEIERVDVIELEPAMVEVARRCRAVNAGVLSNPKVHVTIGDAREVLLTTPERYDLIFSEPSNPYRAGIASLFTGEFYRAARERLAADGVFVQWLQAYEIDASSVRTVYSTLSSEFGSVESWRTTRADLMLVCGGEERVLDPATLATRLRSDPYREAAMAAWRATTVEGILARYVARPAFARAVARAAGPHAVNTDGRNLLEFAVARSLGTRGTFRMSDLLDAAAARGERIPAAVGTDGVAESSPTALDWRDVQDEMMGAGLVHGTTPWVPLHPPLTDGQRQRLLALQAWAQGRPDDVRMHWRNQARDPRTMVELMVVADALAVAGDDGAEEQIRRLRHRQPVEAAMIEARLQWARGRAHAAAAALRLAIVSMRDDPWPASELLSRVLGMAPALAQRDRSLLVPMYELLAPPLAADLLTDRRRLYRLDIGLLAQDPSLCVGALADLEPHVPWTRSFLEKRYRCYRRAVHPRLEAAEADLLQFVQDEGTRFGANLPRAQKGAD